MAVTACGKAGVDAKRIEAANASDWLTYGRTYDEQRFSPLDQINKDTVGRLGVTWWASFDTDRGQEATPLVADGILYTTTTWSKVFAFDAKTGKVVWSVETTDPNLPYTITGAPRAVKGKILIGNGGAEYPVRGYVSAYDADTGKLDWRFHMTPNPTGAADNAASDKVMKDVVNATWSEGAWKNGGGGATPWDPITYD